MKIIELIQGTPEWDTHRAAHLNASDAPAMLGVSPYKTRPELLREKATGIAQEITPQQQRIFDCGHRIEALARPLAEAIIGEALSPCVGSDGEYSASFDGITFAGDLAWECKTLNDSLREAMPYEICDETYGARLPENYRAQLEQQCMVSGCKRILFTAASLASDDSLDEARHCWYASDATMRARLVSGWSQFEHDVALWKLTEKPAPATAVPVESLPAVVVHVQGALTVGGNLPAFGAALRAFIERIPVKPSTDQEFADADAACKALKKAEDALTQAEESSLSQISDVEAMRRTVADLKSLARTTRLATEKLVKAEKDARRTDKVMSAKIAFNTHVQRLEVGLKGVRMQIAPPDFAAAIKGLSSLASIDEKISAALLQGQAEANTLAGRISNNLQMLDSIPQYAFLFADRQDLAQKESETLEMIVEKRVAAHQQAEQERIAQIEAQAKAKAEREAQEAIDAERKRIHQAEKQQAEQEIARIEAQAKAMQESLWRQAKEQAEALVQVAKTIDAEIAASPANSPGQTMNLGQINAALGFTVSADFLASLGILPIRQERAAKLYGAGEFATICRLIQEHLAKAMMRTLSSPPAEITTENASNEHC